MSEFETNLDKLYMSIQNAIQSYDNLDESSKITHQMLNELSKIIDTSYQASSESLQKLNKLLDQNSILLQRDLMNHNKQIKKFNEEYINDVNKNKELVLSKIIEKKEKIKEEKENLKNAIEELTLDTEMFLVSSEQNILLLKNESKEDITKYNYQYNEAKYAYDEDALEYNEVTFSKLKDIKIKHEKSQKKFNDQINIAINTYKDEIKKIDEKIETLRKSHAEEIKDFNDEKKELSIDLNNKIKELNKKHSEFINDTKDKYSITQKQLQDERNKKRKANLKNAQNINKEFILSTENNVSRYNDDKTYYNNKTSELIEESNYDIFQFHKKEEEKLKKLYSSSDVDKNDIKEISKEFEKYYYSRKKVLDSDMDIINSEFQRKIYDFKLEKAKIDSKRQSAIKKYNETESKDNKYYQEMYNKAELESNYEITINKYNADKDINKLKYDNYIKQVDLEARFDKCEEIYLKENEAYQTDKKNYSLEVESSKKIKELVTNMLNQKYNKEVMYLRITGALNIQKCQKLLDYNKRQLEINTDISNNTFKQQELKIKLQNEEKKSLNESKININNISTDINIVKLNNEISNLGNSELYYAKKSFNKFNYLREKNVNEILEKRFNYEIKNINFYTSELIYLINNIENLLTNFIQYIINVIASNYIAFNLIYKLYSSITAACYEFISESIDTYQNKILELIDESNRFEEEFKYKFNYASAVDHYNEEYNRICNAINENDIRISGLDKEIKRENISVQNLIFGIKNDKSIYKVDANMQILTLKKDLFYKNKTLKNYKDLGVKYNEELKRLNLMHEKEKKFINSSKINNLNSILLFKEKIVEYINGIKFGMSTIISQSDKELVTYDNYKQFLDDKYITFKTYFNESTIKIYEMISMYKNNIIQNQKRNNLNLVKSYSASTKNLKNENAENVRNQNQRFEQEHLSKIRDLNIAKKKESDTIHFYFNQNKRLNYQFSLENKEKKRMLLDNTKRLYSELNAINRNILDISNDYYNYVDNVTIDYKKTKDRYFVDMSNIKNNYLIYLKKYNNQRDNDINNIPQLVNEKINYYSNDAKKMNKDIDQYIVDEQLSFNSKKKDSKIQIDTINQLYNKKIAEIDYEQKQFIKKAKLQGKVTK